MSSHKVLIELKHYILPKPTATGHVEPQKSLNLVFTLIFSYLIDFTSPPPPKQKTSFLRKTQKFLLKKVLIRLPLECRDHFKGSSKIGKNNSMYFNHNLLQAKFSNTYAISKFHFETFKKISEIFLTF